MRETEKKGNQVSKSLITGNYVALVVLSIHSRCAHAAQQQGLLHGREPSLQVGSYDTRIDIISRGAVELVLYMCAYETCTLPVALFFSVSSYMVIHMFTQAVHRGKIPVKSKP